MDEGLGIDVDAPNFLFWPCAAPLMDPWALAEPLEEHSYRNPLDSYRQRQALWAVAKTAALLHALPSGWWRFVGSTPIPSLLLCLFSWTEPTGWPTSTSSLPRYLPHGAETSRSWSRPRSIAMGHGLLCLLPWGGTILNGQLSCLHPMEPTTSPTLQSQGHHKLCKIPLWLSPMYRTVSLAHWWVSSGTTFGNGLKWIAYTTKRFPISGGLPTEVPYQPAYSLLAYLNLITVWMALLISSFFFLSYAVSERVLPYINKKKRESYSI